jgi:signal transduction histidine kinase
MLELKRGEPLDGPFVRFVARRDIAAFLNHMHQCGMSHQRVITELKLRRRHGETLPVELTSLRLQRDSAHQYFRTALVDVSERRKAQETLAETQNDFQFLLDSLQALVFEADAQTLAMEFVSGLGERLLGYPVEVWYQPDFWGNHIHVDDRERVLNLTSRIVAQPGNLVVEYRFLAADRRLVWLYHTFTVRAKHGRLKLFGVAVDITARKQIEQQLEYAHDQLEQRVAERTARLRETVADLEAFSYSLSHDMRAPLRAMQGYAHLLNRSFADQLGSQGKEYLDRIMAGAERLDNLIQDVLTFSRVARAPLEASTVDLDALLERVVAEYPALREPGVELQIDTPLLPVRGHEVFLTQCVSNLLTNAVKFTRPGERPHVRVSTRPSAAGVRLYVEDQGIGIAPEDQHRIFGIFQRVHSHEQYEGTGIGLAIVQKAVERMGGTVGVESVPGQGSRFWLQLPGAEG